MRIALSSDAVEAQALLRSLAVTRGNDVATRDQRRSTMPEFDEEATMVQAPGRETILEGVVQRAVERAVLGGELGRREFWGIKMLDAMRGGRVSAARTGSLGDGRLLIAF